MRLWRVLGAMLLAATGCSGRAVSTPAPEVPGSQIVFMVMTGGGRMPAVFQALTSPELVVYQDGRVLTRAEEAVAQLIPARYDVAQVDPAAVAAFVSDVEADGVVALGTDFGTPRVADAPTTTVLLNGPKGQAQVDPYALGMPFETGLTDAQRSARAALSAVIDRARALPAGKARSPYSPDRVVVYELDPRFQRETATVGWPGPPLSSFLRPSAKGASVACGELNADPAEVVYRAALGNPGALWLVNGTTRTLAVNPLPLPDSCP